MTTYIESYEIDDDVYDEREAAELRAEEEVLNGDPWCATAYDADSDDIEYM